jgi:PAS domain S-box-containing protein
LSEAQRYVIDPVTLADALEAGIVVHGTDTAIRYANPKALQLLRLTLDQALGRVAWDASWQLLDCDGRPMPVEDYPVNRVISANAAVRDQVVGIVDEASGRTEWVNVCAYPEYDEANTIGNVVVTFVDVTARVRSERLRQAQLDIALKSNDLAEEPLLQLVLSWCEAITGSTVSFFHFVNDDQETIELVTWSEDTLRDYCRVEELNRHYPISQAGIWAEAFRTRRPVVVNDYAAAANKRGLPEGHARLERFISMPLLEGDMVRVLLGVGNKAHAYADDDVRDLTILTDQVWRIVAQKRSETRARELAHAVEQTPASIVMTDEHGVIRYVNPAFTQITGFTSDDAEGKTPSLLKSGETPDGVYADLWSTISTGRSWTHRLRNRRKDGSLYWANTLISPLKDKKNNIVGYLGIGEDVTDQVKMEEQLRHAQKMEAIGQLTGGVAHDFNNLLGIIRGNLDLFQDSITDPRRQLEILRELLAAVEAGSALTRRLLAFSRRQPLNARPSDLDQLVSSLEQLFRRTLGEKIEVRHRSSPGLWAAQVDPHELEHVLLNLVLNARDAMPDGGALSIDTSNVTLDEDYARQFEEVLAGDYVLLSVSDTGTGMPARVLERAFDPFFTTKETGKGSGLGLSVAYGFAKQSRGHIRLYSEPGLGTTVKLYLPRAGRDEAAAVAPQPGVAARAASARILVVEDNPRLRRMTIAMLTGHGYDVVEAADGPEALLRLGDAGPFQLMITDVGLPGGMNGAEVAAVARMREPSLKVLYMSGYAEPAVLQNHEEYKLISKPFGRNELLATVASLLAGDCAAG